MNFKISNKTFYNRHIFELKKYILGKSSLHLVNQNSINKFQENDSPIQYLDINDTNIDTNEKFDAVLITDIVETHPNVFDLFSEVSDHLNESGKLVVSTFNSKYKVIIKIFEFFRLKDSTVKYSFIQRKKIKNILSGIGLEEVSYYTRQIFPFHLYGLGSFINLFLETFLNYFNLGIMTYSIYRNQNSVKKNLKKTIVIPAKNEEGNLEPLIDRIPKNDKYEIIISCGVSTDNTLNIAKDIKKNETFFKVEVITQSSTGKANAVWEATKIATGDLIAILDADISVDPETIPKFFEIIEKNHADFVNGTRLIYQMEKGSMRSINHFGNRVFQYIVGKIINKPLSDSLCGTKVFKKELIDDILYWQNISKVKDPFGDFDLLFSASYTGQKIIEYPIHYRARQYGVTQISRFRDGYKLIRYLIYSYFLFNTSKF